MKLCIRLITILSIISLIMINTNTVYSYEKYEPKRDIISDYINNDVDRVASNIDLYAKNILFIQYYTVAKDKEKYIEELNFQIQEINELERIVNLRLKEYKNEEYITNGLYAVSLMLDEYRYSITLLISAVKNIEVNDDLAYKYIKDFFIVKSEGDRKLNISKLALNRSN